MLARPSRHAAGFTLVEAVLATSLLMALLVGLAPLFLWSHEAMRAVREETTALAVAQSKLEELRGLTLSWSSGGVPIADPALAPSPPDALTSDVAGYFERLDAHGRLVSQGTSAARFVCRWSITPLDAEGDALLLQVTAARVGANGSVHPATARLATVRTRLP